MGKVTAGKSVSLDGFIAGPNDRPDNPLGDGGGALFNWYNTGDTELSLPGTDMVFKVSRASADFLRESWSRLGVGITGRRTFDISGAWGGHPPGGAPFFVVTHSIPQEWVKAGSPFIFVTEGVERAVEMAKKHAGNGDVDLLGASIIQQCLKAGLLDEIQLDLVPLLLGSGVSLFGDGAGATPKNLEIMRVVQGQGVTHLRYRVLK